MHLLPLPALDTGIISVATLSDFQAGWKESHATFVNELKNLQTQGLTLMGPALKHAFDLLNINRMQTGIDTYGQVSIDDRWKNSQVYKFQVTWSLLYWAEFPICVHKNFSHFKPCDLSLEWSIDQSVVILDCWCCLDANFTGNQVLIELYKIHKRFWSLCDISLASTIDQWVLL